MQKRIPFFKNITIQKTMDNTLLRQILVRGVSGIPYDTLFDFLDSLPTPDLNQIIMLPSLRQHPDYNDLYSHFREKVLSFRPYATRYENFGNPRFPRT